MSGMRSVEEQLAEVLAAVVRLPEEELPLDAALGRTLAAPVLAAVAVPAFDNSAMDGFAVRRADVTGASPEAPVRLTVVADVPAGSAADPSLRAGEAARIMTGAPVPADADAVVPFEDTEGGLADSLGTAIVIRAPRPDAHVRRAGEDVRPGDPVVPAGAVLGPLQRSAVAAVGVARVRVSARPRVAVVATGSELVEPGEPLTRGRIPESNGLLLAGLVEEAGGEVVLRERVPDEDELLLRVIERATAAGAHAIVLSGGVSAGAYEVVRSALHDAMAFRRVAMQPGKPQGFGRLPGGALAFGLPGNPVSSAISFEVFVRPALLAMQGRAELARPVLRMPAAVGWRTPPGRRQYLPVAIDRTDPAAWRVRPATAGGSGSHLAAGLAAAQAWAVVPAEAGEVAAGDPVDVMLIP